MRMTAQGFTWVAARLRGGLESALARLARLARERSVPVIGAWLAVTAVAVVLISWAKSGQGKSLLGGLFDDVIGWVVGAAKKFRV